LELIDEIMYGLSEKLVEIESNAKVKYEVVNSDTIHIFISNDSKNGGCAMTTFEVINEYLTTKGIIVYWIGIQSKKVLRLHAFQRSEMR